MPSLDDLVNAYGQIDRGALERLLDHVGRQRQLDPNAITRQGPDGVQQYVPQTAAAAATIAAQAKDGTVVDAAVTAIRADANSIISWQEISAGLVQLVVQIPQGVTSLNGLDGVIGLTSADGSVAITFPGGGAINLEVPAAPPPTLTVQDERSGGGTFADVTNLAINGSVVPSPFSLAGSTGSATLTINAPLPMTGNTPIQGGGFQTFDLYQYTLTVDGKSGLTLTSGGGDIASLAGPYTATIPGSSSATGSAGQYACDGTYLYIHNGTQWYRVAVSSF